MVPVNMSSEEEEEVKEDISCSFCGRRFNQHKAVYAHMRLFHPGEEIHYKRKCSITCSLCDEEQRTMAAYFAHIRSEHKEVQLSFEKKCFYCEEDFKKWKSEIEKQTQSHYVVSRTNSLLADGRISKQFQCDRSGSYKPPKFANRPKRKFVGSKKIGKTCPAYIGRITTTEGDLMEIEVEFQTAHVGHEFDVHSLRRRSEFRERRLMNRGRGRSSRSSRQSEPMKKEIDVCVNEKVESCVNKGTSDIFHCDPNFEVEQMTCTCKEYIENAKCEHVQTILNSLNMTASNRNETVSYDGSNDVNDYLSIDANGTDSTEENISDQTKSCNTESFDELKTSVLETFQRIVEKCENLEQLMTLKELVSNCQSKLSLTFGWEPGEKIQSFPEAHQTELRASDCQIHTDSFSHSNILAASSHPNVENQMLLQQPTHISIPNEYVLPHKINVVESMQSYRVIYLNATNVPSVNCQNESDYQQLS